MSVPSRARTAGGFRFWFFTAAAVAGLTVVASCDETTGLDPSEPVPTTLEAVSGDGQTGEVGTELSQPLVVRVLDEDGAGFEGVPVSWSAAGGAVGSGSTTTDASGTARTTWTLGPTAGGQSATAEVPVLGTVTFEATAEAGALDTVTVSADSVGFEALADTVVLTARGADRFGNEVTLAGLTWTSRDGAVATVDAAGAVASMADGATWVVAASDGISDSARVTVAQVVASVDVPAADTLTALGDSLALTATPRDGNGFEVPGAVVAWASSDTAVAAIDGDQAVARGNGQATLTATSGPVSGSFGLTVAQAVSTFAVTPDSMAFSALGARDTIDVTLEDANGNAVEATVRFITGSTAVATVTQEGVVQATGSGSTQIVVSAGSLADTVPVVVSQTITRMEVTPAADTLASGTSIALTATAYDANDNAVAATFTWASSDTAVATVDTGGTVTGATVGTASISAATGGFADTAAITVTAGAAATLARTAGDGQTGSVGGTLADSLVVTLSDGAGNPLAGEDVIWTTADGGALSPDTVATDASGRAASQWTLGGGAGTQTATATAAGLTADFTATASALVVDSVDVTPDSTAVIALGDTARFAAALFDSTGISLSDPVTWSSTDTSVATVDSAGLATAVGQGSAWIRATSGAASDSAFFGVVQVLASVAVTPPADTVLVGAAAAYAATGADANGNQITPLLFAWTTLDPAVATVDSIGTVTGVGAGSTSVVATSGLVADTAAVVVVTPPPASMAVVSGDGQSAMKGTALADSLVVEVLDSAGTGIAGVPVTVSFLNGGTIAPDTAVTGALGRAAFQWTMPGTTGSYNASFQPVGSSLSVDFTATSTSVGVDIACADPGTNHATGITADETWTLAGSPHHVSDADITVSSGATLTIEPGAVVCMGAGRSMTFSGADLQARGTAASPIVFTPSDGNTLWQGLKFWGTPLDTTRISNARIEWAQATTGAVISADAHPVKLDSVTVRQSRSLGVLFRAPGSGMYRSTVDTTTLVTNGTYGVLLEATSTLEDVTVRGVSGNATGSAGVRVYGAVGATLRRVRTEGNDGWGLETVSSGGGALAEATGIRSTGNGYPAKLGADVLGMIAPTPADQDSLLGNLADTLWVGPGAPAVNAQLKVRSDLPWRLYREFTVGSGSTLEMPAGTRLSGYGAIFQDGGTLQALGTAAEPILWDAGDGNTGISLRGSPTDTSRLAHVTLEGHGALRAQDGHVVVLDTVQVNNAATDGIQLVSAGSVVRGSSVRSAGRYGMVVSADNTLQDVTVDSAATYGVQVNYPARATVDGLTITNTGGIGLYAPQGEFASASGVRVTGGGSYPAYLSPQAMGRVAGDAAAQDSLLGNASDTVKVNGFGAIVNDTLLARAELPWLADGTITVDTGAVMMAEPGAVILHNSSGVLRFEDGGRLEALGSAGNEIVFGAQDPTAGWAGMNFTATAGDSSVVKHARIERAEGSTFWSAFARPQSIYVGAKTVFEDVVIRQAGEEAIRFGGPGRATRLTVDTTRTFATDANGGSGFESAALVVAHDSVSVRESVVRGAAGTGIATLARSDTIFARVTGAGRYGARSTFAGLASLPPQDSLVGNGRDTIVVVTNDGRMTRDTRTGGLIPLRMYTRTTSSSSTVFATVDSGAVWTLDPGARLEMDYKGGIVFDNGGRLNSHGTAAAPVVFAEFPGATNMWRGLLFQGAPSDSSYMIHTEVEDARGTERADLGNVFIYSAVRSQETHPLVMDSSTVRRSSDLAIDILAPGARISNTVIDTTINDVSGSDAGLLTGALYLRDSDSTTVVQNVTIRNPAGAGLGMYYATQDTVWVRILEANGVAARVVGEALAVLPPYDSLDSGTDADTVVIVGLNTTLRADATIGAGAPTKLARWVSTNVGELKVDSAVTLTFEPGASMVLQGNGLLVNGGAIVAEGTATQPILFTGDGVTASKGIGIQAYPITVGNCVTAQDTSRFKHVIIQQVSDWTLSGCSGFAGSSGALSVNDGMPVTIDSTVVRQVYGNGIALRSGSASIARSVVDSVGVHGLSLNTSATVTHTLIRGSGSDGINVQGGSPTVTYSEVTGSAGVGIRITGDAGSSTYANSNIYGNTGVGLYTDVDSLTQIAESNWWGDAGGPTTGDGVSAAGTASFIDYDPWLTAAVSPINWFKPEWP